ncbi:MAG: TIM barrel protein [Bacteroidota bacterium]
MLFFYPVWSLLHLPLESALEKVKEAGYDGAELAIDPHKMDLAEVQELFKKYQLTLLAQHPFSNGKNFEEYREDYRQKLTLISQLDTPYINCHTGRDYYTFEQNLSLLKIASQIGRDSQMSIGHEIHRGRFSFHPKVFAPYLAAHPEVRITADFSHWCVVTESLLTHFQPELEATYSHTLHIHARVGDGESPQVNDPFAPEHLDALNRHIEWWKAISDLSQTKDRPLLITCEGGPPPYQQTLPYSQMPVSDVWEINLKMKNLLTLELT